MYATKGKEALSVMIWSAHQAALRWVGLFASISLLFGTINTWSPAYIISKKEDNTCDPKAVDQEGTHPICPTVTPPRHPPKPNEDTPRRNSRDT
jgi:hypothetical protein